MNLDTSYGLRQQGPTTQDTSTRSRQHPIRPGPDFKETTSAERHSGNRAASGKDIGNAGIGTAGQYTTSHLATRLAHDWSKGLPVLNAGLPPSHSNPRSRGMRANCTSQPSDEGTPPK